MEVSLNRHRNRAPIAIAATKPALRRAAPLATTGLVASTDEVEAEADEVGSSEVAADTEDGAGVDVVGNSEVAADMDDVAEVGAKVDDSLVPLATTLILMGRAS